MLQRILSGISLFLALGVCFTPAAHARDLTLEDRVLAQEAIERVYYSHQIGASRLFDRVMPPEVLERRVRTYLAQSVALEKMWHTPVTAEMLQRELERMATGTRMPARLQELFAALHHDPVLIQECLARQVLVDRLTRNFFSSDPRIHEQARQDAESLRSELVEGRLDSWADHSARRVVVLQRLHDTGAVPRNTTDRERGAIELEPEQYDRQRALAPPRVGTIGPVVDERETYTLRVVLEELPGRVTIAGYSIPKLEWNVWWSEYGSKLDVTAVNVVADPDLQLPSVQTGKVLDCAGDAWENGILDDLPGGRQRHSAVWTGSRMIVWSGQVGNWATKTGESYDPVIDVWTALSTVDAPYGRVGHTVVWTGSEMIVWGGGGYYSYDTGGRYDPVSDSWRPTSTKGVPAARTAHTAVWAGSEMIVWGGWGNEGVALDTGGRYDPVSDSWKETNSTSGPEPRGSHTAVWTGSEMIVWGGYTQPGNVNTGWAYDPTDDSWSALPVPGGVPARHDHSAVWTGSEMIVWGGNSLGDYENTGGRYKPATASWAITATAGAPAARDRHTAVWTGTEMIVWGGGYGDPNTGGRYDPSTNSWAATSLVGAPEGRNWHTAVWAGDRMIVWGGNSHENGYREFATGGRYDPVSDTWTPTYYSGAPAGRGYHPAVWTGTEMIVWGGGYWTGGDGLYIEPVDTGGRYDPAVDSWTPTSSVSAPDARYDHTAVWTGDYLVVWGGQGVDFWEPVLTGGRYDPIGDTWVGTSLLDAPDARSGHTAVWTGDEMIVWGGSDSGFADTFATGGRYDPYTDLWAPVSPVGSPSPRSNHTAVWSGAEMIVWGGYSSGDFRNTGGRYDPVGNSWSPTSMVDVPSARFGHTAVWSGAEMIVWGGDDDASTPANTGGRYAPATDSWAFTSTIDAPSGRIDHTAVWIFDRMIVWGGEESLWSDAGTDTGGLYEPLDDAWQSTSIDQAAGPRTHHAAVAAGLEMLVWGGVGPLSDGGRYLPFGQDGDDDGFGCVIDCDDSDLNTHPGAPEVNDGLDNQCPGDDGYGLIDEISGNAGFLNPGNTIRYSFPRQSGATQYEIVRSTLADFTDDCLVWLTAEAKVSDTSEPAASGVYFYLSRSIAPNVGSWGLNSDGVERTNLCP